jgi:hypothetical protein
VARRNKEAGPELTTAARREPRPTVELPKAEVVEYQPLSTEGRWRVECWELLAAELELDSSERPLDAGGGSQRESLHQGQASQVMVLVHEALRRFTRQWLIVRRLFGVMPVMVPLKSDPDDFRVWPRAELGEKLAISKEELQQELLAARAIVQRAAGRGEEKAVAGPQWEPGNGVRSTLSLSAPGAQAKLAVPQTDEEYLLSLGYARRMFEIQVRGRLPGSGDVPRPKEENDAEMKWFAGRVRQFEKPLKDKLVSRLADQVLRNELRLKRVEDESNGLVVAEPGLAGADEGERGARENLRTATDPIERSGAVVQRDEKGDGGEGRVQRDHSRGAGVSEPGRDAIGGRDVTRSMSCRCWCGRPYRSRCRNIGWAGRRIFCRAGSFCGIRTGSRNFGRAI